MKLKIVLVLTVIVVSALLISCSKKPAQTEDDYLKNANALLDSAYNKKDDNLKNDALKLFQEFPNLYPSSNNVGISYQKVAEIYMTMKKFDECIKTLTMVTDKYKGKTDGVKAQFQIGYIYFDELKDMDKAKAAFQKLLTDYPANTTPDAGLTQTADQLIKDIDIMKSGKSYEDIINERIGMSDKKEKTDSKDKKDEKKTDDKKKDDKPVDKNMTKQNKTKEAPEPKDNK